LSPDAGVASRWAPVVAWAGVIFFASTSWFTGAHTGSVILPVLAWLFPHAHPHTLESIHAGIRKVAHFTEYLILGVLIMRALRDTRGWRLQHALMAIALATVYAVSDELHQRFVPGRTAAAGDVGVDAMGAVVGQIWIAMRVRRRRKARSARRARPAASDRGASPAARGSP
jgi:VanZ family protein